MHPTAAVVAAVDKWLADAYTTVRGTTRPAVPTVQWLANIRATFMQGSPSQAVQVRLALIDGTSGRGVATAAALEASGAKVVSLHWRSDLQAILPGFHGGSGGSLGAGSSDLRGDWALLLHASMADTAEAVRIGEEAHALGLRLALWVERGHMLGEADLVTIASSDLVLFATETEKTPRWTRCIERSPRRLSASRTAPRKYSQRSRAKGRSQE